MGMGRDTSASATPTRRLTSTPGKGQPDGKGPPPGQPEEESNADSKPNDDPFVIAGTTMASRMLMGSARYSSHATLVNALRTGNPAMVTIAVRRVRFDQDGNNLFDDLKDYRLLPNTAECRTAKDAILTAELARELLGCQWIKLEVIGDEETLLPDSEELLRAATHLVGEGFHVLPYCGDDPVLCRKLQDIGCAAVMPLAAPIGSGMGIRNPYNIRIICQNATIPVIIDAGIGTASDAALAMELGCDGVLVNSAIARCDHPVRMAGAMRRAVQAGRDAYRSGRIARRLYASPSTPSTGIITPSIAR